MSNTFGAPGVYVTESLIAPTPVSQNTSPSIAAFAGEHWRGPTGLAVQCNRWQDFVNYYGGFNTRSTPVLANPWLPYSVYEFFANGGQQCWINRIGASASPGLASSLTLVDSAATPQNTLKLTAGFLGVNTSIGTWGNQLFVAVTPVTTAATGTGTFNITVYYGGSTSAFIVEQWNNLVMLPSSPRYAPSVINSTSAGSLWVYATDLFSPSAPPLNAPSSTLYLNPTALTGGTDTTDPSSTDRQNALTYGSSSTPGVFDNVPGMLNINLPGETTTAVLSQAITYCTGGTSTGRPYSFLVIDPPQGDSVATVIAFMQGLQSANNSPYAALYYPWVYVSNPASSSLQSTIDMPPGGLVLGQYAETDSNTGPWYAPAGSTALLNTVVQTESKINRSALASLNTANVNALRTNAQGQVLIWGARTLLTTFADVYVPIRRTLNYIESRLSVLLEFAIFQPNDPMLWATISSVCDQFLSQIASKNAFAGNTQATQYYVTCNSTNNTPTTIAQGVVNTTVGVALNYPAEFLQLNIQQFQTSGTTTITPAT